MEANWIHAILLGSQPFREKDRIVRLLCMENGKISAMAHSAAVSKKRFPPALLEGFNLLKVDLHRPKGRYDDNIEGMMWTLNGAELKQSYDHFRVGYREIEFGIFPLRMLSDLLPDGPCDVEVFKSLGRYLRDSSVLDLKQTGWWLPLSFWTWFAHFQGFGDLSTELEALKKGSVENKFWDIWHQCLAKKEADFATLFKALASWNPPPLAASDMKILYQRWIEISGIHWKHFEGMILQ